MVIKQTHEEFKAAVIFAANTQLLDVRLAASKAFSQRPPDQSFDVFETSLHLDFKPPVVSAAQAVIPVGVVLKLIAGAEPNTKELAEIECTLEATYAFRPEFTPADEQVAAFQRGNAVFNCWPFFREFLQSNLQKMGYPVPPLPLLRLDADRPKQTGSELKPPPRKRLGVKPSED